MYWLLAITWKRRKGKPREYIALTTGGVLQVLCLHKSLAKSYNVPESWVDFKLYCTAREVKKLAPGLYDGVRAQKVKYLAERGNGER